MDRALRSLVLLVVGGLLLLQVVELLATGLQHVLVHGGRSRDVRQDDQARQDHQAKLVHRNLLQRLYNTAQPTQKQRGDHLV